MGWVLILCLLPGASLGTDPFGDSTMSSSHWSLTPEKILNRSEVQAILERAKERSQRDYTLLCVAANVGIRISEILHIKVQDFNGEQLTVTRRKKKVMRPQALTVTPDLSWVLGEWIGSRKDGWMFPGRAGACYIKHLKGGETKVCDGGHVSRREIQRRFDLMLEGLGLNMKGRGIHTFRHFAITEFYGKYKDLRAAQIFAGHSSSQITEIYAAVRDMKEKVLGMESTL